jgi:hypothetical protein
LKILSIHHVQLAMPPGEEDRARAFYGGVLNLPEVPKPPDVAADGFARVHVTDPFGNRIELMERA